MNSMKNGPATHSPAGPLKIVLCALLLASASGCALMRPVQGNTRFYVLTAGQPKVRQHASAKEDPALCLVQVQPVELAAYLRTKEIVIRTGPNEVAFTHAHKWGESLDEGIRRVLAEDLRGSPLIEAVSTDDSTTAGAERYVLSVDVLACEGTLNGTRGSARLRVLWRLSDRRGQIVDGEFQLKPPAWNGQDYGALAKDLSQGIEDLAQVLIEKLSKLRPDRGSGG